MNIWVILFLIYGVLSVDPGDPLFLSTFIEQGQVKEGRAASEVTPLAGVIQSFSGYLTVNPQNRSNLFFWFFPSEKNESGPVVLWLNGGPGLSSLFGLFHEIGPYYLDDLQLRIRRHRWTRFINVIFIDNPVGTGFSFTGCGYARGQSQISTELHSALTQFFTLFPEFAPNEFYIVGESYAGKYVPVLAYTIHNLNPTSSVRINLKGIAIGNGLIDPENMVDFSDYFYQIGIIDDNGKSKFRAKENQIRKCIKSSEFTNATRVYGSLIDGDYFHYKNLLYNETGFNYHYNYLHSENNQKDAMSAFLNQDLVRRRLHVGSTPFSNGSAVIAALTDDMMKSVKSFMPVLLDKYKVLLYSGQMDLIVPYPFTEKFMETVEWSGAGQYAKERRKLWKEDGQLAGYVKKVGKYTEVMVRLAGHMVPSDQPKWAQLMITHFIQDERFPA